MTEMTKISNRLPDNEKYCINLKSSKTTGYTDKILVYNVNITNHFIPHKMYIKLTGFK